MTATITHVGGTYLVDVQVEGGTRTRATADFGDVLNILREHFGVTETADKPAPKQSPRQRALERTAKKTEEENG